MNRKKILTFIVMQVLFFTAQLLVSQSLPLKHYSDKDGLAYSFVTGIFQDSLGFLWFGTEHGLSRFNGYEFKNFTVEKKGLQNDYIMDILEDQRGNLWIATLGGGLSRKIKNGFITYTTKDGLPDNRIYSLAEDQEGILWVGTIEGLCSFDGHTFTTYTRKNGLPNDFINDIIIDKKGNLWIGTENGLSYRAKKNETAGFINYTTGDGLISNNIRVLMMDHQGNIWIGTQGGLSCRQKEKGKEKETFISYSVKNGLCDNVVTAIAEDRNQNIWIGTEGGLSLLSSGKFTNYYRKNGLLDDKISTVFEDSERNIWLGTSRGASCLHSLRIINFSDKDGLPHNLIWSIIEEKQCKYWIGTNKGLSCYSDGTFKSYTTRDGLINDSIYYLLKDRSGHIWIATKGGLSVYSLKEKKFTNYTVDDGLPHETVLSFAEDEDGTIWIGTINGLCRFSNGRIASPGFMRVSNSVNAMLKDRSGDLWISDTKGLWKIPPGKSTYSYYLPRDGLVNGFIYSLFEDTRGRIWIGTRQGLSCFRNGEFKNYTTADGLSNNVCFFVLEDNKENLWIGTADGINRFDGDSFKIYTHRDGLISKEMSHGACLKDSQGNLWFGTVNGLIRYNPRLDRKNTVSPPVYITRIEVMGKEWPIDNNFNLSYRQNYLRFNFVGLCYTSPADVVYKYRLQGTDSEWVETKDRYISYPSLPPGKYVFTVIAKNNDGIKSLKPAETRFNILPPFWETWWFRMLAIIFILSLVVMIVLFKIKRVKERVIDEAKNKQLVMAQRMNLMGVLAGGAVHDLKNLLAIIISYSDIMKDYADEVDEKEKDEAVEIIKNTAETAFQVVKQVLAFSRQTYDETTAFNLTDLLNEILEILKVTVPPTMKILWDPPKEEMLLYINPVKFKQVVMNLCLNAIQAMGKKGELKISLAKDPDNANLIILDISDTGPGIKQEHLEKIYDPLFTTKEEEKGAGLGLFVVKQIVDEYKGNIRVQTQPGQGTTFKIRFPFVEPFLPIN